MNPRRSILRVEELGTRTLPSVIALPGLAALFAQSTQTFSFRSFQQPGPRFAGSAAGFFQVSQATPTSSLTYVLSGAADVAGLGHVGIGGHIASVSPTQAGIAGGVLRLTNLRGSVTLRLLGPQQAANSPLPAHFRYEVISATGVFFNVHTTGTADLTLNSAAHTFSLKLRPDAV
jgi:hypothetical protein